MNAPTRVTFSLADAADALARLDEGVGRDGDEDLAAVYEGWCQQEWDRYWDAVHRADRVVWLAGQCSGCVEGGTGEVCDEHWDSEGEE